MAPGDGQKITKFKESQQRTWNHSGQGSSALTLVPFGETAKCESQGKGDKNPPRLSVKAASKHGEEGASGN